MRAPSQLSVNLGTIFPAMRELGQPPAVGETGRLTTVTGAGATMPVTPATGLIDVRILRSQLSSIFPLADAYYPTDSIRRVRVQRAAEWVARLKSAAVPVDDRQLVSLAQLAMMAEQDSVARRLFDTRIAEIKQRRALPAGERTAPIELSLTLGAAIDAFADATYDSARIVRNLPIARAYMADLAAIPIKGYGTVSDSTAVLYRQFESAVGLLLASDAIHASADVLAQSDHLLSLIPAFGLGERFGLLGRTYPYRQVVTTLVSLPNGVARIDSLNARMLALAVPREAEFPAAMPERQREGIRQRSRRTIEERIASMALIGKSAPPITAHAWFNTPDSLYAAAPRTRTFNDGNIRVIMFGDQGSGNIAILNRIQHHFPSGVQTLFVTSTEGNVGPDIKPPAEEVLWLRGFYHDIRRVSVPIALWAGEKVPGPLNTSTPARSKVYDDYHVGALQGTAVIVGGDGIVRGYEPISTREDEAHVIDRIERLRAAASATPTAASSPTSSPATPVTPSATPSTSSSTTSR